MALKILYQGKKNSLPTLEDAAFTQDNRVGNAQKVANTTLTVDTPKGVLGGSIASMKGSNVVGAFASGEQPVGLFVNDAAGNPFENTPAVASGKNPHLHGTDSVVEVDVYETFDAATGAVALVYAVGQRLYGSPNGLLTNENTGGTQVIVGIVTKVPTASDAFMGVQLRV